MSDLIAIAYPDQAAVERVRDRLRNAATEGSIKVEDIVVLIRDEDGTVEVRQGGPGMPRSLSGALFGGLIGMIFLAFLAPLPGMAVGAVGPARCGKPIRRA